MNFHYAKKRHRDDHLPPIGADIPVGGIPKIVRRIMLRNEGCDPYEILRELYEKTGIGGPPPYLTIRKPKPTGTENRGAKIVIRHTETEDEESTEIPAADLSNPYDSDQAKAKLLVYCEMLRFKLHAKHDAQTIRFSTVIRKYLDCIDPNSENRDKEELKRLEGDRRSDQDPEAVFKEATLYANDILAMVKDWRLRKLDDDFGRDFQKFAKRKFGQADGTIEKRLTFMRKVFDWFRRKCRPPFRVEFDYIEVKRNAKTELVWEEVQRIILYCLGYVWDTDGFVTEWVRWEGEWLLQFRRHNADHIKQFAAVIAYMLVYFFTGTRATAAGKLGWRPLNKRGWIDVARQWISRNGRKDPNYLKKPQESGGLVPCVAQLLGRMQARDEKAAREKNWVKGLLTSYVVHNGAGGFADITKLAKEAFEAVGIDARRHALKGGGATAYWHAGFSLHHIAWYCGNTEESINNAYRSRKNKEEAYKRPRIDPLTATLDQIVDPLGNLPKIPRRDPPPPPGASIHDADRLIRGELERAIAQVLHG
jgi:hypothetical protein